VRGVCSVAASRAHQITSQSAVARLFDGWVEPKIKTSASINPSS
jgi:hypothetical protein